MDARKLKGLRAGTVAAFECCYGAELYSPRGIASMSIANAYLKAGLYGLIAGTTVAYGPADTNDNADILCQLFLEQLLSGASLGRAFLEARLGYMRGPRVSSIPTTRRPSPSSCSLAIPRFTPSRRLRRRRRPGRARSPRRPSSRPEHSGGSGWRRPARSWPKHRHTRSRCVSRGRPPSGCVTSSGSASGGSRTSACSWFAIPAKSSRREARRSGTFHRPRTCSSPLVDQSEETADQNASPRRVAGLRSGRESCAAKGL